MGRIHYLHDETGKRIGAVSHVNRSRVLNLVGRLDPSKRVKYSFEDEGFLKGRISPERLKSIIYKIPRKSDVDGGSLHWKGRHYNDYTTGNHKLLIEVYLEGKFHIPWTRLVVEYNISQIAGEPIL